MSLIDRVERFNIAVGRACAWLTLLMVLVTFVVVVLRYVFDTGWIWLQESVSWMHAAVFLIAAAYTLATDEHVRVDIFYKTMSPARQGVIDAAGTLIFLIPFSLFLIWTSWDYVGASWRMQESSVEAGGLAYPWVPIWKSMIPAMAILLFLQGIVLLTRSLARLRAGH